MKIDLNCDVGESFGVYPLGVDEQIIPLVSSVNIACGYHAGDPLVMQKTVRLAVKVGAAIGAHPGYPDLQGFGRRTMSLQPEEIESMILYQIGALYAFVRAERGELIHVKPHGALYNQASADLRIATAIAKGVKRFSSELILVGLAGSAMIAAASEVGLHSYSEGFPDRGYDASGGLLPRGKEGAILTDPAQVARHAVELANGKLLHCDTLCLHGDHPRVIDNALLIRKAFLDAGIEIGR